MAAKGALQLTQQMPCETVLSAAKWCDQQSDSQPQKESPPKDRLAKDLKFDAKMRQITNNARANELLKGNPPRKGGKSITSSRSVNRDTRAHMTTE